MYSVYTLTDPRDATVRYVGMGKDAYRRYAMHLLIPGKTKKDAWIKELRKVNLSPMLTVLEIVETKSEAEEKEDYWIQHYTNINAPLTNMNKAYTSLNRNPYVAKVKTTQGKVMRIEEMEQVIRNEGWTVHRLKRREHVYIYAARRGKKHVYIAPAKKINSMTPGQILEKLNKAS